MGGEGEQDIQRHHVALRIGVRGPGKKGDARSRAPISAPIQVHPKIPPPKSGIFAMHNVRDKALCVFICLTNHSGENINIVHIKLESFRLSGSCHE
jgi:hypothetical protein